MNNVAQLSARERAEVFSLTAEKCGMSVAVVEKDFWVCWTLKQLFVHPLLSKEFIFKGGTSLSKAFNLINRFSEDVDLVLDWRVVTDQDPLEERSKNQQNKVNEQLNKSARAYIAGDLLGLLNDALGKQCTLEVKSDEKEFGHIVRVKYHEIAGAASLLPYIQLEIGPLASWLPHSQQTIRPYVADHYPKLFKNPDCSVQVIDAERTFWEKATILHHEANRPENSSVPERYSRHYYDLYMMSSTGVKDSALSDLALLENVVEFKKRFYPRGWANYDLAMPRTFKLIPPDRILIAMRKDYVAMQEMIFGDAPNFDQIIEGLKNLEDEINALNPLDNYE